MSQSIRTAQQAAAEAQSPTTAQYALCRVHEALSGQGRQALSKIEFAYGANKRDVIGVNATTRQGSEMAFSLAQNGVKVICSALENGELKVKGEKLRTGEGDAVKLSSNILEDAVSILPEARAPHGSAYYTAMSPRT